MTIVSISVRILRTRRCGRASVAGTEDTNMSSNRLGRNIFGMELWTQRDE